MNKNAETTHNETDSFPIAFGAYSNDADILRNSSSGGIFMHLAGNYLNEGGLVAGAAMTGDNKGVKHIIAETHDDLYRLSGSKYVKSDLSGIFPHIKELLDSGRKVLFSGTPCQVAGLKNYLKTDYDNLLCIDIICHGVPNPGVWLKYYDYLSGKYSRSLTSVNFRDKKRGWVDFGMGLHFESKYIFIPRAFDPFFRLFLGNYVLNTACYKCAYKDVKRCSDITLGDFWGINKVAPDLYNRYGTSLILVQSQKGQNYINGLDITKSPIELSQAIKAAPALTRSAKKPLRYDDFQSDLKVMPIDLLADKFCPVRFRSRVYNMLSKTGLSEILHRQWRF